MPFLTTLNFAYKEIITSHHLQVLPRPLIPDAKKSLNLNKNNPLDDNLIIHGDNLEALKALLPKYGGRVKCVYIDPPYNTGNEGWKYNDNVNSPYFKHWLKKTVDIEDLARHDKWCCMMWPRLNLLKELLSEDGSIFVSIDDNELHHLRAMMDEIFGEENFRNIISVRRGIKNVQSQFEYTSSLNVGWESILFYSKSPDTRFRHLTRHLEKKTPGGWNNHWRGTDRRNLRYPLMGITPESGQWRWSEERSLVAISNYKKMTNEIGETPSNDEIAEWYFAQSPQKPDLLRMSKSGKPEHYVAPTNRKIVSSLWTDLIANETNSTVKQMTNEFDNPKNTKLLQRIVEYACGKNRDGIILDSFAGSGTTAHAVLALNKDSGNRKFILVECEDYAHTITAERVRRVINGVLDAKSKTIRNGTGGSFTYCTLGEPIDVEKMLTGESLPNASTIASYLLYQATGISTGKTLRPTKDGLFYSTDSINYYLIYKPSLDYLRSNKASLTAKHAKAISMKGKPAVVFAADKEQSQRDLSMLNIKFCRLPDAIVRN